MLSIPAFSLTRQTRHKWFAWADCNITDNQATPKP
jgi:hypothetical protein